MKKSFLQPEWRHTGLLSQRFKEIEPYVAGKKVLDVGCAVGFTGPNWLHALIKEKASYVKGLDINEASIKILKEKGYDVVYADAQNFDFQETFDVVHAGELIEHLDNFHGFLQSCRAHLDNNGLLVLTTPNAMRAANFIYSAFGGLEVNSEHTCWFCDRTITALLERNGFKVKKIDYLRHETRGAARKVLTSVLRRLLPPRLAWNTLLVVATIK